MTVSVPSHEPVWQLDRRDSSGLLFWRREASKVKFRCDVEVLEFVKEPHEDVFYPESSVESRFVNTMVMAATCLAAVAVTVVIPWFLIGGS